MTDDRALRRIEKALTGLGAEHAPPAGWEARVIAATREARVVAATTRRPRHRLIMAGAILAATAALVLWWAVDRLRPTETGAKIAWTTVRDGERMRGDLVTVGDRLHATARSERHGALWLYGDGRLVLACPGARECTQTDETLSFSVLLQKGGTYRIVALSSDAPLDPPGVLLDRAVAAALDAGAVVDDQEDLTVH